MKIFFDSNVVLAAVARAGACRSLMDLAWEFHTVVLSEQVLDEYSRYIISRLKAPPEMAVSGLQKLRQATIAPSHPRTSVELRDQDDVAIVSAAVNGKCDLLVTGDHDLLDPCEAIYASTGLRIINPAQAMTLLTSA